MSGACATTARQNQVCLCLNAQNLAENLQLLQSEPYWDFASDLAELRLDFMLDFSSSAVLEKSLNALCRDIEAYGLQANSDPKGKPRFVLTLRRVSDAGLCPDTLDEAVYWDCLQRVVSVFPAEQLAYVDLDVALLRNICDSTEAVDAVHVAAEQMFGLLRTKRGKLIISFHDFGSGLEAVGSEEKITLLWDDFERLALQLQRQDLLGDGPEAAAASGPEALAPDCAVLFKFALMVGSSDALLRFYRLAAVLRRKAKTGVESASFAGMRPRPYVLLAMGEYGSSTRILSAHIGSRWTFCMPSSASEAVAPGQFRLSELHELYRYRDITPKTTIYGVVGDPIAHSRSPEIHNPIYRQHGWDSVYLRFRVDRLEAFLCLSDLLPLRGFSCTVPHKESLALIALAGSVAGRSSQVSEVVQLLQVSNTFCLQPERSGRCFAENTDPAGFLQPLLEFCAGRQISLSGKKAVIVGAGGAARAVVYALLSQGVDCEIYNRTLQKAEYLQHLFASCEHLPARVSKAAVLDGGRSIPADCELLIQTASLGMYQAGLGQDKIAANALDPIPAYQFRPGQIVYDLIYNPPRTVFLQRAERAGAWVLNGSAMLEQQALAQIEVFQRWR